MINTIVDNIAAIYALINSGICIKIAIKDRTRLGRFQSAAVFAGGLAALLLVYQFYLG